MMDEWLQAILIGVILGAVVGNLSSGPGTDVPKSTAQTMAKKKKKALCIGCNYTNSPNMTLYGCVSDAERMARMLSSRGYDVDLLTSNVTRLRVLAAMAKLVVEGQPGDQLVLQFSGHGSYVGDVSGDEADGRDECLVLEDGQYLLDDDMNAIVRVLKPGIDMRIIFDCCHSGSSLDFAFAYQAGSIGNLILRKASSTASTTASANVVYLGACRDNETAADTVNASGTPTGALTEPVLEALTKKPDASCYEVLCAATNYCQENGYDQRPQLSSLGDIVVDGVQFIP